MNIYNINQNKLPVEVEIKTMEEIDERLGGISDKPHLHNYYTIIWSTNATGKHIIDFKEYELKPNDIFFVSPYQVHQLITNKSPKGYVFLFTEEFLKMNSINEDFISNIKLFKNINDNPPLSIDKEKADKLNFFANQMCISFRKQNSMFIEIIGAYLKLFIIECNNICTLDRVNNTDYFEISRSFVKDFKYLVEKNFKNYHKVQEYAKLLNINPNYLNEVIKTNTNFSAKDYIKDRIILEAKRLIVFSNKTAKEISYELGFNDPSHFSKFFKSKTNISIQDFRESISL